MLEDNRFKNLLSEIQSYCDDVQVDFAKKLFEKAEPKLKPSLSDLDETCITYDLLLILARLNFYHQMRTDELRNFLEQIFRVTPLSRQQVMTLCDRLGANENAMLNELGYFAYGGVLIDVFFCVYDAIAPKDRQCQELTDGDGLASKIFKVPEIHVAALSFELAPMFMDMGKDCDNMRNKYVG